MKKFCMLLAMLLLVMTMCIPAFAEDEAAEMAALLEGEWVHVENSDYRLLFDGTNMFYYDTDESFYYGLYSYEGNGQFRLFDDVEEEHILVVNDDVTLELEGIEGYFYCTYGYRLMDFPNTDEGTWLNDDGVTTLIFDLEGEFEYEDEDAYYYGEYVYQGEGDYLLTDDEGNDHIVSLYTDGSISMEGVDGYFWLQSDMIGDDPFEYVKEDDMFFGDVSDDISDEADVSDAGEEPIELAGVWYKYGDADSIPFVLDGDTYSCEHSVFGYETTGTWEMDEIVMSLSEENTEPAAYISMTGDDGAPGGWDPTPMAGNRLLFASAKDAYFLHESLIGTEEGDMLCKMADFMCADWYGESMVCYYYLQFTCMGNAIVCNSTDEDGESESLIIGDWEMADGCIVANYIDGSTVSYDLMADEIEVDGLTFTK